MPLAFRALGSIALDMCFAAEGTPDGVIDTRALEAVELIAGSYGMKDLRRRGG